MSSLFVSPDVHFFLKIEIIDSDVFLAIRNHSQEGHHFLRIYTYTENHIVFCLPA